MNVYDKAHQLAKALKESSEYQTFKSLEKNLQANPSIKSMMEDFKKRQFEVQSAQMRGHKVEKTKLEKLQEMEEQLMKDSTVGNYLEAEFRFTQMLSDIYKIIGESIEIEDLE